MSPLRRKMPLPLEAIEREILGCCFHGHHDWRLTPYHFPHVGRRIAFAGHEALRRAGYLCRADDSDGGVWRILAAEHNAVFLATHLERLKLWPCWGPCRHELLIECCRPIGPWHESHFHDAVSRLIDTVERMELARHHRRIAEEIEAGRSVAV